MVLALIIYECLLPLLFLCKIKIEGVSKAELFSASVSNFGGIVGGALAYSTATGYYQKLSLVGCSVDVKYVPAVSNTNIEPIVGENSESTSGSKMVIIDSGMVSDCSVSLWSE